jgi:MFS family permease
MTTALAPTTAGPAQSRARIRVATAVFLLNGLTLSTWIVRVPALKRDLTLTDVQVGALGVAFAVAAIAAMQVVGAVVHRYGSATVLRVALVAMPVLLAAAGSAPGPLALAGVAAALGAAHGTTDAAMNAHAVAVERSVERPILNRCHAAWSASAALASLASAGAAGLGVPTRAYLALAGAFLLGAGLVLGLALRPVVSAPSTPRTGRRQGWTRPLVVLGLTGTLLMVCEGSALGWGALLLQDAQGAPLGVATLAVTAYTAAQTAGRLLGDGWSRRHGAARVYRAGALLAAAGLTVAVLAPVPALGILGFAVMGTGMATLLPLTFSAVGVVAGTGSLPHAVARFTTFTYGGVLLGPALVGGAAQVAGLPLTLGCLAPGLLVLAVAHGLPQQEEATR